MSWKVTASLGLLRVLHLPHNVVARGPSFLFYPTPREADMLDTCSPRSMLYHMPHKCQPSLVTGLTGEDTAVRHTPNTIPESESTPSGQRRPRSWTLVCGSKREAGKPVTVCPPRRQLLPSDRIPKALALRFSALPPVSRASRDRKESVDKYG